MFTGIVEATGVVREMVRQGSNVDFVIESSIGAELRVDQSVAHNGVCLTVTRVAHGAHWVTAIDETLSASTLGQWAVGQVVNLERCMPATGRFDGHIVQGHVDQTGMCSGRTEQQGSWLFDFEYDPSLGNITVEKGSICVNGVSLTCFRSAPGSFRVAIIPYTFTHTNFNNVEKGSMANLEFDILGKYIQKLMKGYKPGLNQKEES